MPDRHTLAKTCSMGKSIEFDQCLTKAALPLLWCEISIITSTLDGKNSEDKPVASISQNQGVFCEAS